jgi:hypothetical protein
MALSTISGVGAGSSGTILTTGTPQSGGVIQVVNATYSSLLTTTSTTLITTNVTASISPKFSTSKILILLSMNGCNVASTSNAIHFELFKNGSYLSYLDDILGYGSSTNYGANYQYYDTPATTSSTTYAVYLKSTLGTSVKINNYYGADNRTVSSITLLEVAV